MNYIAMMTYLTVWSISSLFLAFLIKCIKDKPLDQQNVIDTLRTDMAFFTFLYLTYVIWMIIIREIVGPYQPTLMLDGFLLIVLFLYYCMVCSVVSHQITQLLTIFFSNHLMEASEFLIVSVHRSGCFLASAGFSGFVCYFKAGTCNKSAFVNYFTGNTETEGPAPYVGIVPMILLTLVSIMCQLSVEVRRCLSISEDLKAERAAAGALANMEAAAKSLETEPPKSPRIAWTPQTQPNGHEPNAQQTVFSNQSATGKGSAIRMARFYCVVLTTCSSLLIGTRILNEIDWLKPHGQIVAITFGVGILMPIAIIATNSRMKASLFAILQQSCSCKSTLTF